MGFLTAVFTLCGIRYMRFRHYRKLGKLGKLRPKIVIDEILMDDDMESKDVFVPASYLYDAGKPSSFLISNYLFKASASGRTRMLVYDERSHGSFADVEVLNYVNSGTNKVQMRRDARNKRRLARMKIREKEEQENLS